MVEGTRERIQPFQGVVIRRQGTGARETFTVRKLSYGVGSRADLPRPLADSRQDRGPDPGRRSARQAVLPARPGREGGQGQGEACRRVEDLWAWRRPEELRAAEQMSEEDLERYEAEIELALVQEYRTVLPLFQYVVETERRFYLANDVKVSVRDGSTPTCLELELSDAWVWDMYRPARFVPSVRVLTFRDVNVERIPDRETLSPDGPRASTERVLRAGIAGVEAFGSASRGAGGRRVVRHAGFTVVARNWRSRTGEIDLVARLGDLVVICEVKTRSSDRFGSPIGSRHSSEGPPAAAPRIRMAR